MADRHPSSGELTRLDEDECWHLVRSRSVGRFGANRQGAGPLIVPVNYLTSDDPREIVLRSGAGSKLNAAGSGLVVLQVDHVDPIHRDGWSVLVEGTARWLYEEQDESTVETWALGDRPYVIRITPTRVTGRQIDLAQADLDGRGYR